MMLPFRFHRKKKGKPSKEGVNLLASILVCYEEISRVSFDPQKNAITLTFTLKEEPKKEKFDRFTRLLAESVTTYLELNGLHASVFQMSVEVVGDFTFLHIARDVTSLTRDELTLLADILYESFPETLLLDEHTVNPEAETEQEDMLDRQLGIAQAVRMHQKLLGIREGDRVVVYNQ